MSLQNTFTGTGNTKESPFQAIVYVEAYSTTPSSPPSRLFRWAEENGIKIAAVGTHDDEIRVDSDRDHFKAILSSKSGSSPDQTFLICCTQYLPPATSLVALHV